MKKSTNGWDEYQKLVMFRLDSLTAKIFEIDSKVDKLQVSFSLLRFKVSVIGASAGALVGALLHLFY